MIHILNVNPYSSNNIDSYSTIHHLFPNHNIIRNNFTNHFINKIFNIEFYNHFIHKMNEFAFLIFQFIFNFYNYFNNHSHKLLEPFTNALDTMNSKMYMTFGSFDEKYIYSSSLFMINLLCFFIILFAVLLITEKIYDKIHSLTNEVEMHNKLRFRMNDQIQTLKNHINELYRIQNYIIIQNDKKINKKMEKKLQKNNNNEKEQREQREKEEKDENNKESKEVKENKNHKNKRTEYLAEEENHQDKFGNGRYSKRERKTIQ